MSSSWYNLGRDLKGMNFMDHYEKFKGQEEQSIQDQEFFKKKFKQLRFHYNLGLTLINPLILFLVLYVPHMSSTNYVKFVLLCSAILVVPLGIIIYTLKKKYGINILQIQVFLDDYYHPSSKVENLFLSLSFIIFVLSAYNGYAAGLKIGFIVHCFIIIPMYIEMVIHFVKTFKVFTILLIPIILFAYQAISPLVIITETDKERASMMAISNNGKVYIEAPFTNVDEMKKSSDVIEANTLNILNEGVVSNYEPMINIYDYIEVEEATASLLITEEYQCIDSQPSSLSDYNNIIIAMNDIGYSDDIIVAAMVNDYKYCSAEKMSEYEICAALNFYDFYNFYPEAFVIRYFTDKDITEYSDYPNNQCIKYEYYSSEEKVHLHDSNVDIIYYLNDDIFYSESWDEFYDSTSAAYELYKNYLRSQCCNIYTLSEYLNSNGIKPITIFCVFLSYFSSILL